MRYCFILFGLICMTQFTQGVCTTIQVPLKNEGKASYYHPRFHGRKSASGQIHDREALTAAHRTLPFGTHLRVTNLENNKSVIVRVDDRGPYRKGRIIDVSERAAKDLDFIEAGVVQVRIEIVPYDKEPLDMEEMFPLDPMPSLDVKEIHPELQPLLSQND